MVNIKEEENTEIKIIPISIKDSGIMVIGMEKEKKGLKIVSMSEDLSEILGKEKAF